MAYNEDLANRVREVLVEVPKVEEKKMFRGITFMVDGKMCICVGDDELMLRIDPALHEELVEKEGCRTMVMRDKPYKGYVLVAGYVLNTEKALNHWTGLALDFNKHAKASKKSKKKK
jgi:TfoX/Sxy family transcriptional regulator of competence genes